MKLKNSIRIVVFTGLAVILVGIFVFFSVYMIRYIVKKPTVSSIEPFPKIKSRIIEGRNKNEM